MLSELLVIIGTVKLITFTIYAEFKTGKVHFFILTMNRYHAGFVKWDHCKQLLIDHIEENPVFIS